MDAVSYPDTKVISFITDKLVPLRVPADAQPMARDFRVTWTPTIIMLDFYGREHHRTVGFLSPEEFLPSLLLGIAKVAFDADEPNEAVLHLNSLLSEYPESAAAPEAAYMKGVSRYKASHDSAALKDAYQELKSRYPGSEWAKRAQPYSLL